MLLPFQSILLLTCIHISTQSDGDRSPFYQKCLERCKLMNCSDDGLVYKNPDDQPSIVLKLLQWTCNDECCYECMWKTVEVFQKRNWQIPQFYGKWPFYRILGLQEPASVLFSLINMYMHFKMLRKFRKLIRYESPLYGLWHFFTIVCINAWIWSSVFHARDTPQTETLDYSTAFSIVLVSCYCMIYRILYKTPRYMRIIISTFFIALFYNHVVHLSSGRINYNYNMQLNITIGCVTAVGWFFWCVWNRYRQPYAWKCAAFVALTGFSTMLEVIDRPPIYFMVDCHALWHLCSAPLIWLFYNFLIDDCRYLYKTDKLLASTETSDKKDLNKFH